MSRLGITLFASLVVTALAAPGAVAHEGVSTVAGHAAEDAVFTPPRRSVRWMLTRASSGCRAKAAAVAVAGLPRTWGNGARSSTGRSSACTLRCCPTARCSPTTRSATTPPRRYPVQDHTRATVWDPRRARRRRSTSTRASTSSAAAWRTSSTVASSLPAETRTRRSTASSRPTSSTRRRTRGASARTWRPGAGIRA